jgi:hypothetical protein
LSLAGQADTVNPTNRAPQGLSPTRAAISTIAAIVDGRIGSKSIQEPSRWSAKGDFLARDPISDGARIRAKPDIRRLDRNMEAAARDAKSASQTVVIVRRRHGISPCAGASRDYFFFGM